MVQQSGDSIIPALHDEFRRSFGVDRDRDMLGGPLPESKELKKEESQYQVIDGQVIVPGSVFKAPDGRDLVVPTEEELVQLRRVPESFPLSALFVVVVELCERFAYYGISGCFQNYMQKELGYSHASATAISSFFNFWCYFTPILGAIIADQYTGRFKAIAWSCLVYIFGLAILTGTSAISLLDQHKSIPGFFVSIILIGIGTGLIKPNVSPLIAEQIPNIPRYKKTLSSGETVLVDPAVTSQRIFSLFYWCINVGSLSSLATTYMEQDISNDRGFWAAYLLPTVVFFLAPVVLLLGYRYYILRPPTGSIFLRAIKASHLAARNGWTYEAAKPSYEGHVKHGHWRDEWDDQFIEEMKRGLKACKLFVFFPFYWLGYLQMTNNLNTMNGTMQTGRVPNDFLFNIDPISIIIFIPIYEFVILPSLRKIGIRFLPITRVFLGFMCVAIAMAYCALVQHIIYTKPPYYQFSDLEHKNNLSVWIIIPAYVFMGWSEILASVTGLEYAFTKAPTSMKSTITSLYLLTTALGAVLSLCVAPAAKNPKLVWLYTGIAIAAFIAGVLIAVLFWHLNEEEDELNDIEVMANEAFRDQAINFKLEKMQHDLEKSGANYTVNKDSEKINSEKDAHFDEKSSASDDKVEKPSETQEISEKRDAGA